MPIYYRIMKKNHFLYVLKRISMFYSKDHNKLVIFWVEAELKSYRSKKKLVYIESRCNFQVSLEKQELACLLKYLERFFNFFL